MTTLPQPTYRPLPIPPAGPDTQWLSTTQELDALPIGTRITDRDEVSYLQTGNGSWVPGHQWDRPQHVYSSEALLEVFGAWRVTALPFAERPAPDVAAGPGPEWLESVTTVAALHAGTEVVDDKGNRFTRDQFALWHVPASAWGPGVSAAWRPTVNSWSLLFHFGRVRVVSSPPSAADVVRQVMADAHNIPQDLFADEIVARLTSYGYLNETS